MSPFRLTRLAGVLALGFAAAALSAPAVAQDKKDAAKKVISKLKITVPQDDAELKIEGKATKPTGSVREFVTPEIEAGRMYEYTFETVWRPNNYTVLTRTYNIEFKGGDEITTDMSKKNPKVEDKAVVRWVPTPDDIVAEMLKLANVKKGDIAYEPGPGDARMLIAAVKAGADKGVGIELDPKKAAEGDREREEGRPRGQDQDHRGRRAEGPRLQRGVGGVPVHGERVQQPAAADPGEAAEAGQPHRQPPVRAGRLDAGQEHHRDRHGRRRVQAARVDGEGRQGRRGKDKKDDDKGKGTDAVKNKP